MGPKLIIGELLKNGAKNCLIWNQTVFSPIFAIFAISATKSNKKENTN